jgi:hypothetical protein
MGLLSDRVRQITMYGANLINEKETKYNARANLLAVTFNLQ